MAATTSAQVIARAEARARLDPDFADLLAHLVDAPTSAAGEYERVAARQISDRRRRDALDEFLASALPTSDVQALLHLGTPQAVHRMRSRGRLIGLQLGNHTWFPAWQFSGGDLRPDLPLILERLAAFTTDPVAADRVMRLVREDLDGSSIAGALDRPERAGAAWSALAELTA
jgi:hypothetical protein